MNVSTMSNHRNGHITIQGVVGLVVSLFVLISSILFVVYSMKKSERISHQYLYQTQQINTLTSSMAHLSMWLNTFKHGNESEQHEAIQNITILTDTIAWVSQNLHDSSYLDKSYTSKLQRAMTQLNDASHQIIALSNERLKGINLETLVIDYRSVYQIAEFHLSTVRDLSIEISSKRSHQNNKNMILFLVLELIATVVIASFILFIISGRSRAEKRLQKAESILADLFDSMPSALITLNRSGAVTRMNPTARNLCREKINTEPEQPLFELFPLLKEHTDDITQLLQGNSITPIEISLTKDERKYRVTFFPMSHSDGTVLNIEDITKQEELAEELRHTQKMNAIGQLAGGIAHDFNNVLGGIINAAELLKNSINDSEGEELLEIIQNASMRAADLTRKLLTFSKKDMKKVESVNINEVLHSMDAILRHSLDPRVSSELHLEAGDAQVVGDAANLQNMFLNLGINAGHAMTLGGTVIYSTSRRTIRMGQKTANGTQLSPGEYLQIEVTDTGEGIPPENLNRIFDPFFTTKKHGTGIGLAVTYSTITQAGGSISVESTLGEGTTFQILLPIVHDTELIAKQLDEPKPTLKYTPKEKLTILVIDDEEIIRKSAALLLKKLGYSVILGNNGKDGVEIFRKNQNDISIILLDMQMPVMNGNEALLEIRKISESVPVVICSGFAHPENFASINDNDIQGMLTKPYTLDALQKSLKGAL